MFIFNQFDGSMSARECQSTEPLSRRDRTVGSQPESSVAVRSVQSVMIEISRRRCLIELAALDGATAGDLCGSPPGCRAP